MARVAVALGSNLGDREQAINSAIACLSSLPDTRLAACGGWYGTRPWGDPDQPWYLNTAILLETGKTLRSFFSDSQAIEHTLGRTRDSGAPRWGPRTIDIDLILWDTLTFESEDLVIPHPRLRERDFVLRPLADIDPGLIDPVSGATVDELLARLDNTQ